MNPDRFDGLKPDGWWLLACGVLFIVVGLAFFFWWVLLVVRQYQERREPATRIYTGADWDRLSRIGQRQDFDGRDPDETWLVWDPSREAPPSDEENRMAADGWVRVMRSERRR